MQRKMICIWAAFLACLIWTPSVRAQARWTVSKPKLEKEWIQDLSVTYTSDVTREVEVRFLLEDAKGKVINAIRLRRKAIAQQPETFVAYTKMIGNPFQVKILLVDPHTELELQDSCTVPIEGAVVAPEIASFPDLRYKTAKGADWSIPSTVELQLTTGARAAFALAVLEPLPSTATVGKYAVRASLENADLGISTQVTLALEVVEERSISALDRVDRSFVEGERIALPPFIGVTYTDGAREMRAVTWALADAYAAGDHVITGKVEGLVTPAKAFIRVLPDRGDTPYAFADPVVQEVVQEQTGKAQPTWRDLRTIASLDLSWQTVGTLEDLRSMRSLRTLDLTGVSAPSYTPLEALYALEHLTLFATDCSDVTILAPLQNLRTLNAGSTPIRSLVGMEYLGHLMELNLNSTQLRDIKPLRHTTNLRKLSLPSAVEDLTPIAAYNGQLEHPFPITLRKLVDGVVLIDPQVRPVVLPYAVEGKSGLVYVDWAQPTLDTAQKEEVTGVSAEGEIVARVAAGEDPMKAEVKFPDKVFEQEIRKAIDKPYGAILQEDVMFLKTLDVSGKNIADFTGIEHLRGLRVLKVWANPAIAKKLSVIRTMRDLEYIDFGSCRISSITSSTFSGLSKIVEIALDDNPGIVISQDAFSTIPSMRYLHVNGCGLTTLACLQNLRYLESLYADDNAISSLKDMSHLTMLKELQLGNNRITDLSPLANMGELTSVRLAYNAIRDLSPLAGATKLNHLRANNNQITSLEALRGCADLEYLYLSNNRIADVSPLAHLLKLRQLELRDNRIADVGPLRDLTALKVLFLSGNPIEDYTPLEDIYPNLSNRDFELKP